jgi:transposase
MIPKECDLKLSILPDDIDHLTCICNSRIESVCRVQRAEILLGYNEGVSIEEITRNMELHKSSVVNCIEKAVQFGSLTALDDLPRSGRPRVITDDAISWLTSIACQKPKDLILDGDELWTQRELAKYLRLNCKKAGYPCLSTIVNSTVSKILKKNKLRPWKIDYYLQKRDPEFEPKRDRVIDIYRIAIANRFKNTYKIVQISYDEKTGIQGLKNVAPDLPPVIGLHSCISRDYEYIRLGTLSLLAGMNITTGEVHGIVEKTHRSVEFIKFLKMLLKKYEHATKIQIVLDNHSAHTSKETRAFLSTVPNRFEFIFTPKHGSWLNMIESFFGKMAKTIFRGLRVESMKELKSRILKYLRRNNRDPVPYKWTYRI